MPRPPGIIERANYIVRTFNNPCNAPWAVYVETAIPAFLEVWIALVCFDILDVIRFIFRPAGLRSGRHLRRGKKGSKRRRKQGIGQRLKSKVPALNRLQQRGVTQGVRNLWIIDGIGQRLLWWWLVADVATSFLYNWSSMIRKSEFCQAAESSGASLRENTNNTIAAIASWITIGYDDLRYEKGNATDLPNAVTIGIGRWEIVASCEVFNRTSTDTTVELRIINVGGGAPVLQQQTPAFLPGNGSASLVVTGGTIGGGAYAIQARVLFGGADLSVGARFFFELPNPPLPPISHTCKIPFVGSP